MSVFFQFSNVNQCNCGYYVHEGKGGAVVFPPFPPSVPGKNGQVGFGCNLVSVLCLGVGFNVVMCNK